MNFNERYEFQQLKNPLFRPFHRVKVLSLLLWKLYGCILFQNGAQGPLFKGLTLHNKRLLWIRIVIKYVLFTKGSHSYSLTCVQNVNFSHAESTSLTDKICHDECRMRKQRRKWGSGALFRAHRLRDPRVPHSYGPSNCKQGHSENTVFFSEAHCWLPLNKKVRILFIDCFALLYIDSSWFISFGKYISLCRLHVGNSDRIIADFLVMFVWNKRPSAFSSKGTNLKCKIIKQAFSEIRNGKYKFEMFVKVGL